MGLKTDTLKRKLKANSSDPVESLVAFCTLQNNNWKTRAPRLYGRESHGLQPRDLGRSSKLSAPKDFKSL